MIWLEYVGSKPAKNVGITEDFEHQKFFWGESNNWKCEVPDILASMIIEEKGVTQFRPCIAPNILKKDEPIKVEKPEVEKPKVEKPTEQPKEEKDARKHKIPRKRGRS